MQDDVFGLPDLFIISGAMLILWFLGPSTSGKKMSSSVAKYHIRPAGGRKFFWHRVYLEEDCDAT